jgi:hypothetical protein
MIYGLSAALFGEITVKNGRVEQGNFDTYPVVRLKDAPKTEVYLSPTPGKRWGGVGEPGATHDSTRGDQRDLRRHRQAPALATDPRAGFNRGGVGHYTEVVVQWPGSTRPLLALGIRVPSHMPHRILDQIAASGFAMWSAAGPKDSPPWRRRVRRWG